MVERRGARSSCKSIPDLHSIFGEHERDTLDVTVFAAGEFSRNLIFERPILLPVKLFG